MKEEKEFYRRIAVITLIAMLFAAFFQHLSFTIAFGVFLLCLTIDVKL